MLILGLDVAQNTGWALYDTEASLSAIRAGVLKSQGDSYEEKAASLGQALVALVKGDRPHFVAIEMPIRSQPANVRRKVKCMGEEMQEEGAAGGINAIISSNQMVGAVSAITGAFKLPFQTIAPVTWRTQFLGFGRRAGWQRKDWKKAVRERCSQLKIVVTNDDMADAVGVAFAGAGCQRFKMMQAGRAA